MKAKLLIIALLCIGFIHSRALGTPAKAAWEYMILSQDTPDEDGATKQLNLLGSKGWEVVAVVPDTIHKQSEESFIRRVKVYLKRQKQ